MDKAGSRIILLALRAVTPRLPPDEACWSASALFSRHGAGEEPRLAKRLSRRAEAAETCWW
jgi:hypothetical protein